MKIKKKKQGQRLTHKRLWRQAKILFNTKPATALIIILTQSGGKSGIRVGTNFLGVCLLFLLQKCMLIVDSVLFTGQVQCRCNIFVWSSNEKIVIR